MDGYLLWLNDEWEAVLGYSKQELMSQPFLNFVYPPDVPGTLEEMKALNDGQAAVKFINRYVHKEGHLVHLSWTSKANSDGTIFAVAHDVTEDLGIRKQAELRASLLDMVEDVGGIGTWRVDIQKGQIYWSPRVFAIHGVAPENYVPNLEANIRFYHPDDRPKVEAAIEESFRTREDFAFVLRLVRADGQERWVESRGRPEFGADGPTAITGVFRDVTEQRHYEQSLRDAREKALDASRAKSQFLANMSHEVRTPMNGVLGMAELLAGTNLAEEQREFVEHIQSSGQALIAILNDILDLSKIEAGQIDLEETSFSVERIAHDVALTLASQAEQKGIALFLDVDPKLPRTFLGDPLRFRQVLLNLTSNAIKFTERGSVEIQVELWRGVLRVRVEDTGIGIPPERQQAVFQPFAQADDSTTRRFGGTGLGLTICQQIIELAGGQVRLESEVGVGTSVTIDLPLEVLDETPLLIPSAQPRSCVVISLLARRRAIVERLLRAAGHQVNCSEADVESTSCLLTSQGPKVVIVDVEQLTERLALQLRRDAHVIVGLCPQLETRESIGVDVDVLIRTPVHREALLAAVEQRKQFHQSLAPSPSQRDAAVNSIAPSIALHILLAEDNPVNTKVALRMLEKLGHTVLHAENGAAAIAAWEKEEFDLVLMDVHMPELDGFEATRRIRELEKERPKATTIVALTANAMKGDEERCMRAGMDAYLAKPLNHADLRALLARLQRKRSLSPKP